MESETAYGEVVRAGPQPLSRMVQAMFEFLGRNDMMAYLVMMAQRMIELRRVLKPSGSIYLHCDPTASHYLKLLMDATFGAKNILNEIICTTVGQEFPRGPAQDVTTSSCGTQRRPNATTSTPILFDSLMQRRL